MNSITVVYLPFPSITRMLLLSMPDVICICDALPELHSVLVVFDCHCFPHFRPDAISIVLESKLSVRINALHLGVSMTEPGLVARKTQAVLS
jgi:hypothetical protein